MKTKKVKVLKLSTEKRKAWDAFSKYIRTRDSYDGINICVTCNRSYPVKDLQAGHFITRRAKSILYHEKNVHAQCEYCNHWGHGEPLKYQDALIKMYGTMTVQVLRASEHSQRQWKKFELEALIQEYTDKVPLRSCE